MKAWISENGGMLAVLAVALAILAAYGEWRIDVAVADALADLSFPSDTTIEEIHGTNKAQDVRMDGFQSHQEFTDAQLRDIGRILMQRPDGE